MSASATRLCSGAGDRIRDYWCRAVGAAISESRLLLQPKLDRGWPLEPEVEGTSEAFLAASAPRVAHTCSTNTRNRARPGSRAHSGLRGWSRDGGSSKLG